MGSETVIFVLLAAIVMLVIFWRDDLHAKKAAIQAKDNLEHKLSHARTEL
jgi:hypothetical protein